MKLSETKIKIIFIPILNLFVQNQKENENLQTLT